ncbi:MAG: SLC13 family permease [Thermoplasmata archaeon]
MLESLHLSRLLGPYLDPRLVSNIEFLILLFLMMLVMNLFELSGFLSSIGRRIVNRAGTERRLAILLCLLVFFASAFLTNDVVLLGIAPLTIHVGVVSRINVRTLGIFEGLAANTGSLLTPFGNPQNIFISVHYSVSVSEFLLALLPLWLLSFGLLLLLICVSFGDRCLHPLRPKPANRRSAILGLTALAVIVLFFFRLLPILIIAPLVLGLILSDEKYARVFRMFDWRLFSLFVFMVLATYAAMRFWKIELQGPVLLICAVGLSQVVSNVPATFLLSGSPDWRTLAIGVNIGGNGTLISSVATVIAYRYIKKYDRRTTVWDFMKWGVLFCGAQTIAFLPILLMTMS